MGEDREGGVRPIRGLDREVHNGDDRRGQGCAPIIVFGRDPRVVGEELLTRGAHARGVEVPIEQLGVFAGFAVEIGRGRRLVDHVARPARQALADAEVSRGQDFETEGVIVIPPGIFAEPPIVERIVEPARLIEGVGEFDDAFPILHIGGAAGKHAEFAGFEREVRQVEAEHVVRVRLLVILLHEEGAERNLVGRRRAGAVGGVALVTEDPLVPVRERDRERISARRAVAGFEIHRHVVGVVDDDDGGQVEVDGGAALGGVLDVDAEHHHHAVDVGCGRDVELPGHRLGAQVPEVAEIRGLRVERSMVAVVGQAVAVGGLADVVRVRVRRRRHDAAGVRIEGACLQRRLARRVPADLLVESMVVAQGPPGGPAHLALQRGSVEDRGHGQGVAVERHAHGDGIDAVRGPGRGGARHAAAELGSLKVGIREFEGQGKVALQASMVGIGQDPGRAGGKVMEKPIRVGRCRRSFAEAREVADVAEGLTARHAIIGGMVLESGQERETGGHRVA